VRVLVDLSAGSAAVSLADAGDFSDLRVDVIGTADIDRLDAALRNSEVGQIDGEDAVVFVDALRRLPAERGAGWEDGLAGLISSAGEAGRIEDDGGAIRAHVVVT
jgi:hypothetical protein